MPDAGRILQETRPSEQTPGVTVPPIELPQAKKFVPLASSGDMRVQVTTFSFTGNTVLKHEELEEAVAPWVNRALTFGDLIEAVEAVEARYKAAGYFLAQGYLPPQKIRDGVIEILISEGILADVRLEGESRVNADTLYAHLDPLPKGNALKLPILERQILLINELAGGAASLDLQAGEKEGSTDIVLALKADDAVTGRVELNNHGSPSTGTQRLGLTVNALSPFHVGERISFQAMTSAQRLLNSYNLRGELPVGGQGWKLTASASRAEYSLGAPFKELQASGTADSLRFGIAYPFLRTREANLKLQLDADKSVLSDQFKANQLQLDKQSRGLTATLSGDLTDQWLGGGSSRADLTLKIGQLQLGSTAKAADNLNSDGAYRKLSLSLQRQQTLTQDLSLNLQLTQQLASKNLDSSEKLSLGGPTSIPGYANGEGSGDSGSHAKVALRWQASQVLAVTAFADYAKLKLAHDPLPGTTNHKRLTDLGLSIDGQIGKDLSANLILAWATGETPNPGDNDKPRLWLTLGYLW